MKRFSTLFAILLILSISTYVGDIQNAVANEADWMPDANLRAAVRSALNLGNNDALTQAGMASLTRLTARNAQISNLTGLEHATNLTSLDLRDNTINNISALSGLTNLESLKLKGNDISSVSGLSGLTNLTLLNLKENNISSISDLSGLTNLEHLRVDANSITDVQPLTSLVNLERLWIAGNSLTNAHLLSSLTGLTQIDIPIPDPPDTTAPRVSISAPSGVQNGAFDATITFSETVSGFTQSDVSLRGSAASITSWRANSGNTVYTATITPTASGTVTVGVAANVATDAANNQNTAATSKSVTVSVDTTAPGVTVSAPSGVQNGAFSVTITFTEAVSDFVQSEVSLSGSAASITSWSANSGNTVYTATITPTASGTVTIGVAANVATDAANNPNTAATSKRVTVDVGKPSVSISVPSGTQTSAFNATITFSETVSGFTQSDVSLSGSVASITSWSANSGNTVYTATITPTASGTVTIGVAANVATDAANNQNTTATSKTVTVSVDTTAPGVTVSVPSGVQNGAFSVTITFTETVSGFAQSEVSLSGSAASITGWSANRDSTVYTATITPTASGTVTIGVAANVATDAANNQNTAATSKTVTVSMDTTAPGVTVSVPSGVQNGTFNVTITFTETVSGFTQSEVSLSGSAASITGWSANSGNTVYTATITPTASGTVTIGVAANVATDAANNQNTAATSKTVTIDVDAPTVTIGVPSGTQTGAFDATITFTETVSGFAQSDVSLSGSAASITGWSANSGNTVYTATITPTASGTVTVGVAANVATDAAGNNNTAATSQTVTVNIPDPIPDPATWMPDANLRTAVRSALSIASDEAFSKADLGTLTSFSATRSQITNLTGLEYATNLTSLVAWGNQISSLTPLTNLTKLTEIRIGDNQHIQNLTPLSGLTKLTRLGLQGNNISNVTPLKSLVNLTWLRLARNPITDFSPLSGLKASITDVDVTIPDPDTTRPSVSITVPSGSQTGAFDASITFSETVSGFVQSDVSLSGSAASITSWNANSDDTVYTATITPTASGTVTIGVAANVAIDAANNQNTAAISKTVTVSVDTTAPGVTVSVPSGTQNSAFDVTITFTETVLGFVQSEVSLSGSAASITSWSANSDNTVYTATITPMASGTITLGVAANVATDAANNPNTAATSKTVTVDVDRPTTTIGVPSDTQTGAFDATITFTETVSGFTQSDVSLSGSAASITLWSANSDNTVYTATITPTASGTVTVGVAADVATDAVGNPNTAATSKTVTVSVDTEAPSVSISVPSGVQNSAFDATITFTEVVLDFEQTDLLITGTADTIITAWKKTDDTVYTAEITPKSNGIVKVKVPEGVATDAAKNLNTASATQETEIDVTQPDVSFSFDLEERFVTPIGYITNGPFEMTITFTEPVSGFEQSDLEVDEEYTFSDFKVIDAETYTVKVTPDPNDNSLYLSFHIETGVATDAAGNPNTSANSPRIRVEKFRPNVEISVSDSDVETATFTIEIKFDGGDDRDDRPLGFEQSDLSLTNNTAGATIMDWTVPLRGFSSSTYGSFQGDYGLFRAEITATQSGSVTFGIPEGVATDLAGNLNTAAVQKTVTITLPGSDPPEVSDTDTTQPDVSFSFDLEERFVTPIGYITNGPFEMTITFTEPVSGFEQSDLEVDEEYTFADFKMIDASTSTVSDVEVHPIFNPPSSSTDVIYASTYTVKVIPDPNDSSLYLGFHIETGVATDAAGNPNTSANSPRIRVEKFRPNVEISVPDSGVETATFTIEIKFDGGDDRDDRPLGFEQSDLSLTNNTAGATITDWTVPLRGFSSSAYSSFQGDYGLFRAEITATQSGSVTFGVPEGVATDLAGNLNTAAVQKTVTITLPDSLNPKAAPLASGDIPDETLLLPNYPNPFNPETWIPYHLANDTDVQISIYDINGALVRQLDLGHQRASYYTDRNHAAYWDGCNEFGERVATGVYFYQLQAGSESFLRKMVILK